MTRSWQDNAREFGALTKQGVDVRLALLVACSVEKGNGQGARKPLADRQKVGAIEFTREALGTTNANRVLRHLDAWNKAAAKKWCAKSDQLTPDDAGDPELPVPTQGQFESVFDASKSGGRPRASVAEITEAIKSRPDIREAVLSDPDVAEAIEDHVASDPKATVRVLQAAQEKRPTPPKPVPPRNATGAVLHLDELGIAVSDLHKVVPEIAADIHAGVLTPDLIQKAVLPEIKTISVDLEMLRIAAQSTGTLDAELAELLNGGQ